MSDVPNIPETLDPEIYQALGLTDEEAQRIVAILGRNPPVSSMLGMELRLQFVSKATITRRQLSPTRVQPPASEAFSETSSPWALDPSP